MMSFSSIIDRNWSIKSGRSDLSSLQITSYRNIITGGFITPAAANTRYEAAGYPSIANDKTAIQSDSAREPGMQCLLSSLLALLGGADLTEKIKLISLKSNKINSRQFPLQGQSQSQRSIILNKRLHLFSELFSGGLMLTGERETTQCKSVLMSPEIVAREETVMG